MVIESPSMDTTSTFGQADDPTAAIAFKGEYVCGEYRVVREYHVAHGSEVLQESTQYYADGWLLRERYDRWIVDRNTNTVRHSSRPIEEFCRSRHMADVRTELSYLDSRVDDSDGRGTDVSE